MVTELIKKYYRKKVVLVGSGFSATQINDYDYKSNGWTIVVVNGGWNACKEIFDYHLYPIDYHQSRRPKSYLPHQKNIGYNYQKSLLKFGGQKKCGLSATLNVAYWILDNLNPNVLGFLGCDMNYTPKEDGSTCIYGVGVDIKIRGQSDPDFMVSQHSNGDPNYLNNIYMRLVTQSKNWNGCKVVNLSTDITSRLPYDRCRPEDF